MRIGYYGFDESIARLKKIAEINKPEVRDEIIDPVMESTRTIVETGFRRAMEATTDYSVNRSKGVHIYSMDAPTTVMLDKTPTGYEITAIGEDVLYEEFGTGVYYNGAGSYPIEKSPDIGGIGSQGKGYGNRNTWGFYKDDIHDRDHLILTHGNKAFMPMYNARKSLKERLIRRFKEL